MMVLALFTVGDVYASLFKRGTYAPFRVLPPSSVATRLRAVVQVRKRPGCAPY